MPENDESQSRRVLRGSSDILARAGTAFAEMRGRKRRAAARPRQLAAARSALFADVWLMPQTAACVRLFTPILRRSALM